MECLQSYGSSDSGSEGEGPTHTNGLSSDDLAKPLDLVDDSEAELEDLVKPRHWEIEEAAKMSNEQNRLVKQGRQGPVKISLPELPSSGESSDDEKPQKAKKRKKNEEGSTSKLLSWLPAPENSKGTRIKLNLSQPGGPVATSFVPRSAVAKKPAPIPADLKKAESDSSSLSSDEESSKVSSGLDFLGLTKKPDLPADVDLEELKRQAQKETEQIVASKLPSNILPYENEPKPAYPPVHQPEPDSFDHFPQEPGPSYQPSVAEVASQLPPELAEEFVGIGGQCIDVNVDHALGNVHENLLKQMSETSFLAAEKREAAKRSGSAPSALQRRKHQLTYLAHVAKEREAELEIQWANNRHAQRQNKMKYGFI